MNTLSTAPLLLNLAVTAVAVAVLMLATMAVAVRLGAQAIVDTVWGLGFVVVAAVSFLLSGGDGDGVRRTLVLALVAVWGLRLAGYIFWRNRGTGEDPRYAAMLRRNQGPLVPFLLRKVYGPQGAALWFVSLPVQVAMHQTGEIGVLAVLGILVWAVGLAFEVVGDAQLARFKADPGNAGKVLDTGLWGWTRHPNYFGDTCVWWGLWLLACSHWVGLLTVASPLLMTYLLANRSGKPLLERGMAKRRGPEYADYLARTSGFVPRRPRPRSGSGTLP